MGDDAASDHAATLDEWAAFIAGMAMAADEPAMLVGHSRGGVVISRAAEMAPAFVSHLVYLAAGMVMPGQSMAECFADAEGMNKGMHATITPSEDGRWLHWGDPDIAAQVFYNTCSPEQAAAACRRLTPEPTQPAMAPAHLTEARYGAVPRSYIRCLRDQSVPLSFQAEMIARQPCRTHDLDTDHSPFYCAPDALSALLDRIARS